MRTLTFIILLLATFVLLSVSNNDENPPHSTILSSSEPVIVNPDNLEKYTEYLGTFPDRSRFIATSDGGLLLLGGHSLTKTDPMGAVEWSQPISTSNYEIHEMDDGFIVGLKSDQSINISKISQTGEILWSNQDFDDHDRINAIQATTDQNIIIVRTNDPNGDGYGVGIIAMISKNGQSMWYLNTGSDGWQFSWIDIIATADGGILLVGSGSETGYVVKYGTGGFEWEKFYPVPKNYYNSSRVFKSIATKSNGNFIILGVQQIDDVNDMLWRVEIDANGNVIQELGEIKEHQLDIVGNIPSLDGGYLSVYDIAHDQASDAYGIEIYDNNHHNLWKMNLNGWTVRSNGPVFYHNGNVYTRPYVNDTSGLLKANANGYEFMVFEDIRFNGWGILENGDVIIMLTIPQDGTQANLYKVIFSDTSAQFDPDWLTISAVLSLTGVSAAGLYYFRTERFSKEAMALTPQSREIISRLFRSQTTLYFVLTGQKAFDNDKIENDVKNAIPYGISEFRFLLHPTRLTMSKLLYENLQLTSTEIKEILGLSWNDYNNNMKSLIRKGYVDSTNDFTDDKRKTMLCLTSYVTEQFKILLDLLHLFLDNTTDYQAYIKQAQSLIDDTDVMTYPKNKDLS